MYKLFLTLRYLTRKKIVIFPILVVWLCVMMLIIVTSIMQGFVDRVRDANRDLYGDIIISSASSSQGFAGYEELTAQLKRQFPQIKATTPVVEAYALLYVGGEIKRSVPTLLVGVNPEERTEVSKFREGLFRQYQAPMQAVDDLQGKLPANREALLKFAQQSADVASEKDRLAQENMAGFLYDERPLGPAWGRTAWLLPVAAIVALLFWRARRRHSAWGFVNMTFVGLLGTGMVVLATFWPVMFPRQFDLAEDRLHQTNMALDQALRTRDFAAALPPGIYKTREDLVQAIVPREPTFNPPPGIVLPPTGNGTAGAPAQGCIVGAQIGFLKRDTRGNFVHRYPDFFPPVTITVFPPSKSGKISVKGTNAVTNDFSIVDFSHSGVYDVDSLNVYAAFDTVQLMAGMRPDPALGEAGNFDKRTHQILIRLAPDTDETEMRRMRQKIDAAVQKFVEDNQIAHPDWFLREVEVQTWDEKQARYLGAVQNEKTMMTFILYLMSGVVLVVIFLIFYQIVRDKTKDIGIIKAVGGSELGVAAIFLSYGLLIGVVGGGLGSLTGYLFVTHTNQIHEMIYQATGIIIWDRSVYLFDRIPDVVRLYDVVQYFGIALVAGLLGSLIPAIIAALEDPVQAVRYE